MAKKEKAAEQAAETQTEQKATVTRIVKTVVIDRSLNVLGQFEEVPAEYANTEEFLHIAGKRGYNALTDEQKAAIPSWDEIQKSLKPVKVAGEGGERAPRAPAAELTGPYYVAKQNAAKETDAKYPIWAAIYANSSFEAFFEATKDMKINRAKNGVFTPSSEMRYAVRKGFVVAGEKPAEAEQAAA